MVNVFLIVSVVILSAVLLAACVMLLAYFGHPDDRNEALFPKVVTVFGLWLAFASVLVLPYDVSNSRGEGGGLRVDILWQIIYMLVAIMVTVLIPFAFFFYESDVDREEAQKCCTGQFWTAFRMTAAFFVVFSLVLIIMWAVLNEAQIPVKRIAQDVNLLVASTDSFKNTNCGSGCLETTFTWELPVTFPVYVIAFLSWLGWWFFSTFVGVGLVSLPLDLINEWRTRPEPMTTQEYYTQRNQLGKRAKRLMEIGKQIEKEQSEPGSRSRKVRRAEARVLTRFEQAYYFLKRDFDLLEVSHKLKGGNPLWYFMKLVLGVMGGILSITWVIHIGLFMFPEQPVHPFLNQFFIELEEVGGGGFPLFGIAAFGLYSFWLIWCCVMGNFKLGIRFLCMRVYPMELHNTMMNSFLANTWIILICSVPAVQFCVQAFPVYARFTAADLLIGTQAQYLQFFRLFWENDVFIIMMLCFSFLTFVYLVLRPKDTAAEIEKVLDRVAQGDEDAVV